METRAKAYSGNEPFAFVSYSHKNSNIVYPIIKYLINSGYNIWYDQGIPLVADYGSVLYQQIKRCAVFVLFVSKQSVVSEDVKKEILHAISFKKEIVQVIIDEDAQLPDAAAYHLPPTLQHLSIYTEPSEFYAKLANSLAVCKNREPGSAYHNAYQTVNVPHSSSEDNAPRNNAVQYITDLIKKNGIAVLLAAAVLIIALSLLISNAVSRGEYNSPAENDADSSYVGESSDNTSQIDDNSDDSSYSGEYQSDSAAMFNGEAISIGDHIYFGSYEQDGDSYNGAEPIEWRVLDISSDNSALVISVYALDHAPYHDKKVNVTWSTCTLREWMNNDFYNDAFSSDEGSRIREVKLSNPDNAATGTFGGVDTRDKVFSLNIDEAKRYFDNDNDRRCKPTRYSKSTGAWTDESGYCWWWLRSPGLESYDAAGVYGDGDIGPNGDNVNNFNGVSVRPAIYIELDS